MIPIRVAASQEYVNTDSTRSLSHYTILSLPIWLRLTRMAYTGRVGGGSYIAQQLRNSIAVVWVMLMGGGNEGMIDSCTHKNE